MITLFEQFCERLRGEDAKDAIKNSKKLPEEMKEKLIKMIPHEGIIYKSGRINYLKIPRKMQARINSAIENKGDGCDLGADKNGFFVFTHRARSKSYPNYMEIPKEDIAKIAKTS